jgi:hypothetical protein
VPKQATDRDLVRKFLEGLAAIGNKGAYSGAEDTAAAYPYRRKGVA